MKRLNRIVIITLLALPLIISAQEKNVLTMDHTFSGGNNGGWTGNMATDVVKVINSVDGLMDVTVNKVGAPWSILGQYMANCWSDNLVLNQTNRYMEFRVKCNVAQTTPIPVTWMWNGCDACCAQTKTIANGYFTLPEADEWKIVFLQIPQSTGGSQNVIDTLTKWLALGLNNGNYSFDYVKLGQAAIPPTPTIDAVKTKTVSHLAGVQTVNLSNISIPNRFIDGLTIRAESLSDGILADVTIIDLGSGPFAVDEATNIATAALQFTPVVGMFGLGDSIIITLKDTIRNKTFKSSFYVNLIGSGGGCTASTPSAADVSICSGNTATLTATGGTNYRWYTAYTGGTLLGSNAVYTTPVLTSSTTYYVANYNGTCESSRDAVSVSVGSSVTPNISSFPSITLYCNSAPVPLSASPTGGVFSGDGVELGYFVPAQAKVNHMNSIIYTYGNVSAGCYGKDSIHVFVFPCIGMDDDRESVLTIFPNPTEGFITIDVKDMRDGLTMEVTDELGRVIFEEKKTDSSSYTGEFDLTAYPAGIYFVKVILKNNILVNKVVKY